MNEGDDELAFEAIDDILEIAAHCAEEARAARDVLRLGVYLKMAARALRCALETYNEHLAQNRRVTE